jgi:aminopeptidase
VTDPRLARYADLVCDYSLGLEEDHRLAIIVPPVAEPFAVALARAAFARGAHVTVQMDPPWSSERMLREAGEEQLRTPDPAMLELVAAADRLVTVLAPLNSRANSTVGGDRTRIRAEGLAAVQHRFVERISSGAARWVGCAYPTATSAQDARMSTAAFERFVFAACLLDEPDPAAAWRAVAERQDRLVERLSTVRELRARAPGTDLVVGVEGVQWENASGRVNLPDGEVFCSPRVEATQGEITYTIPSQMFGRRFERIHLRFRDGVVVDASAEVGQEALLAVLDTDEGARRLGEFAVATNPHITRAIGNTLFDEKIGGTFHTALGFGFPHLGGTNTSAIHWDIVCDLRQGGTIEADGEPIVRDGRLLVGG